MGRPSLSGRGTSNHIIFRADNKVHDVLILQDNKSEYIRTAIIEKYERDHGDSFQAPELQDPPELQIDFSNLLKNLSDGALERLHNYILGKTYRFGKRVKYIENITARKLDINLIKIMQELMIL